MEYFHDRQVLALHLHMLKWATVMPSVVVSKHMGDWGNWAWGIMIVREGLLVQPGITKQAYKEIADEDKGMC